MGESAEVFNSQLKLIGGEKKKMTEIGNGPAGIRSYELLLKYSKEAEILEDRLTNPRIKCSPWRRSCRVKQLLRLQEVLLPPLQMMFPLNKFTG
jgi:hypothetical protein